MSLKRISFAVALAVAASLPLVPGVPLMAAAPQAQNAQNDAYANRIYKALLGRDADAAGLKDTSADIGRGRTRARVDSIVASQEFRQKVAAMTPEQVLNQIYMGLLDRAPDANSGGWLDQIKRKRYTDVIMGITGSQEFRNVIANNGAGTGSNNSSSNANVDAGAAQSCQERVTEAVRNDLTGYVFLQFDKPTMDGSAITGAATDVADGNRRLTYRCDGNATYNYDDGRRQRSAAASGSFNNASVNACVDNLRNRIKSERNISDVEFESAGLMPNGDTWVVRGLGFEKNNGNNGANFTYTCTVNGTSVQSASYQMR